MSEQLKESLEEHKANVEAIDYIDGESVKRLYVNLVNEVHEALESDQ